MIAKKSYSKFTNFFPLMVMPLFTQSFVVYIIYHTEVWNYLAK